jgi:signal peptidase I
MQVVALVAGVGLALQIRLITVNWFEKENLPVDGPKKFLGGEMSEALKSLNKKIVEESLKRNGKVWVKIEGRSMEPVIKKGDRVLVEEKKAGEITPGDVILYSVDESLIVHRAVGRFFYSGKWFFLEKGELGEGIGRISEESLLGRVVAVEGTKGTFPFEKSCEEWRRISGRGYALLTFIYAFSFKIKHFLGINPKKFKSSFFRLFLALERRLHRRRVLEGGSVEKS